MFGFLKKKLRQKADIDFVHTVQEYGEGPSEFVIFSSINDEEVQKKEHLWISWQVFQSILENNANLVKYADSLEKVLDKYADKKVNQIFGGENEPY